MTASDVVATAVVAVVGIPVGCIVEALIRRRRFMRRYWGG